MIGSTIFSAVNVNRYICCDCGFTEEWIDKEDIEKVANSKKAKRVETEEGQDISWNMRKVVVELK